LIDLQEELPSASDAHLHVSMTLLPLCVFHHSFLELAGFGAATAGAGDAEPPADMAAAGRFIADREQKRFRAKSAARIPIQRAQPTRQHTPLPEKENTTERTHQRDVTRSSHRIKDS